MSVPISAATATTHCAASVTRPSFVPQPPTFFAGMKAAYPIVLGYLPVGMAFGVLASASGFPVWGVALMSVLVYAGSGQFIGASMWAQGAAFGTIVFTIFLVNMRHLLFSAALAPSLRYVPRWKSAGLSYTITDESFAVATATLQGRPTTAAWLAGLQWTSHTSWLTATVLGAVVGRWLPDTRVLGLDFALPAMFIALLIMQVRNRGHVAVAALAGVASVWLAVVLPGNWNVIAATLLAATVGVLCGGE